MHLVRSVDQMQGAGVGVHLGERPVIRDAGATEELDGPVDHRRRQTGRHHLDRGDLEPGTLVPDGVHEPRRLHGEQPGLFDLDSALGDALLHHVVVGQMLPERDALLGSHAHQLEGPLGHADGTHAVMDAAGTEAGLGDREPAAFLTEEVLGGKPDVLVQRLAMAAARVVVQHRQGADDRDPRGVQRDDDHRVAPVRVTVGARDPHQNREPAPRRRRPARPPFVGVHDVVVAVALDAALDVRRVAARHPRLGHREAGADLPFEERPEELLLLQRGAELGQDLHVPGVGC